MGYGVSVCTGTAPVDFGWKDDDRRRDGVINPGELHLLTHGDFNTPRWIQTFEEVSLVLDRQLVADIVQEGLPPEQIGLATQRSVTDGVIVRYAAAFCRELACDSCNGPAKRQRQRSAGMGRALRPQTDGREFYLFASGKRQAYPWDSRRRED